MLWFISPSPWVHDIIINFPSCRGRRQHRYQAFHNPLTTHQHPTTYSPSTTHPTPAEYPATYSSSTTNSPPAEHPATYSPMTHSPPAEHPATYSPSTTHSPPAEHPATYSPSTTHSLPAELVVSCKPCLCRSGCGAKKRCSCWQLGQPCLPWCHPAVESCCNEGLATVASKADPVVDIVDVGDVKNITS